MMTKLEQLTLNDLRDCAEAAVTIAAAYDAGLFEGLVAGPATADALADRLGLSRRGVGIVLPVLAELGLVEETDGRYALTPTGRRRLADRSSPEFAGGGLPLWLENIRTWTHLGEAIRTGRPVGRPSAPDEPEAIARFMAGMAAAPEERVRRAVELCLERKPDARTVLDLGGGPGHYARAFVDAGLEVTMMDRPATVEYVADAYGLADVGGLHLVKGDFLQDPLPKGPFDIVLMSNILHIYSPEENRALLGKVAGVTAEGGEAAILEFLRGRSPRAARFAVIMLLRNAGGNAYTADEYRAWLKEAGFASMEIADVDEQRQLVTALRS